MGRPRGFMYGWKPKDHVLDLITDVNSIISESEILPLTLRQIFYMLVSNNGYDKTEKAYKRLCETMNKARRAKMTDMDDIRDDGLKRRCDAGYNSKSHFINSIIWRANNFTLNRQKVQPIKLYVWCEAGGMLPQLADAVEEWHIPVLSSGGFDSVTTKHNLAQELALKEHVVILHLGDHDPSGVHMYGSLDEDLQAFMHDIREEDGYDSMENDCELIRIAVTPEQVEDMHLPTAPAKATDKRSFEGLTTQCEAIHPTDLRRIVRERCLDHIDDGLHEQILAEEKEIEAELKRELEGLI